MRNPLALYNKNITFGKYKGRTPLWIYINDNQYFNWCINNLKSPKWVSIFKSVLDEEKKELEIKEEPCSHLESNTDLNGEEMFCMSCGEILF